MRKKGTDDNILPSFTAGSKDEQLCFTRRVSAGSWQVVHRLQSMMAVLGSRRAVTLCVGRKAHPHLLLHIWLWKVSAVIVALVLLPGIASGAACKAEIPARSRRWSELRCLGLCSFPSSSCQGCKSVLVWHPSCQAHLLCQDTQISAYGHPCLHHQGAVTCPQVSTGLGSGVCISPATAWGQPLYPKTPTESEKSPSIQSKQHPPSRKERCSRIANVQAYQDFATHSAASHIFFFFFHLRGLVCTASPVMNCYSGK